MSIGPVYFCFKGCWVFFFSFLFKCWQNIFEANSRGADKTPHFAAYGLDLYCFPMSHKKDAMLKWVNEFLSWLDTMNKYDIKRVNYPNGYALQNLKNVSIWANNADPGVESAIVTS